MKINKTERVLQIYNKDRHEKIDRNNKKFGKDEIKLSEKAMDYQFAIRKLKELPEIRVEKVKKLKEELKSGNYNIEGRRIVEKIYESINFDKKI